MLRRLAVVNAMAAHAAHIALAVRRALEVRMRARMAAEALCIHIFRRGFLRVEDFALVSAPVHVRLAGSVTVFAGYCGAVMLLCEPCVWIKGKVF